MIPGIWILDLMSLAVAVVFLVAAITGNFYSGGRGKRRLVASVKSAQARALFLVISIGMFILFGWLARSFVQR
jgi:hypothetical protein